MVTLFLVFFFFFCKLSPSFKIEGNISNISGAVQLYLQTGIFASRGWLFLQCTLSIGYFINVYVDLNGLKSDCRELKLPSLLCYILPLSAQCLSRDSSTLREKKKRVLVLLPGK